MIWAAWFAMWEYIIWWARAGAQSSNHMCSAAPLPALSSHTSIQSQCFWRSLLCLSIYLLEAVEAFFKGSWCSLVQMQLQSAKQASRGALQIKFLLFQQQIRQTRLKFFYFLFIFCSKGFLFCLKTQSRFKFTALEKFINENFIWMSHFRNFPCLMFLIFEVFFQFMFALRLFLTVF